MRSRVLGATGEVSRPMPIGNLPSIALAMTDYPCNWIFVSNAAHLCANLSAAKLHRACLRLIERAVRKVQATETVEAGWKTI